MGIRLALELLQCRRRHSWPYRLGTAAVAVSAAVVGGTKAAAAKSSKAAAAVSPKAAATAGGSRQLGEHADSRQGGNSVGRACHGISNKTQRRVFYRHCLHRRSLLG